MLLIYILGALAFLSLALLLWQWFAAARFPLHQRANDIPHAPAVTVLKPLKGCDDETRACLESWLRQNYSGPRQILFGVASAEDPVCVLVRSLLAEHPNVPADLVICPEQLGPNAKVSTLVHLSRRAAHDVLVISDADVRVPEDFLAQAVQPLRETKVGLVNCLYRFANPSTLAMHWEAIAVNADFWSQVLQSKTLKPIDFALGAAMVLRKKELQEIGGFESLLEYLADDYQLGHRLAQKGKEIVLSPVVVECWESPRGWRDIWQHQLRWARTIRVCQPAPFFFSILSNPTLWPLLLFAAVASIPNPWSGDWKYLVIPLTLFLPVRLFAALKMEEKLTGKDDHYAFCWLIPLKDLLGAAIWAMAFFGSTVEWRGERFRVLRGGRLVKL